MKKIALFLSLLALTFTASAEIPFTEAWSYVASFTSYWVGVISAIIASILGGLFINKRMEKKGIDVVTMSIIAILLFIILYAVLGPVAESAANSFVKEGKTIFIR
jgi:asparagine N-glycosylation enzyme membrane subunit Stt3